MKKPETIKKIIIKNTNPLRKKISEPPIPPKRSKYQRTRNNEIAAALAAAFGG